MGVDLLVQFWHKAGTADEVEHVKSLHRLLDEEPVTLPEAHPILGAIERETARQRSRAREHTPAIPSDTDTATQALPWKRRIRDPLPTTASTASRNLG